MKYEAIIFDLDGTLLNTLEDLTDAVNVVLAKYNMPIKTLEQIRQYVGNGIVKLMERAVPEGRNHAAFDKALEEFKQYYSVHCRDKTAPYPGILNMLQQFKEHGVRMAIVSNKADFAVKELNPVYFQGLIEIAHGENEAAGIRKKPSPDMVFQALREMDCGIDKAVYVGDSDVDLATAANAGMTCIGVSWGFRGREFLEKQGAELIVDTPEELLALCFQK